MFERLRFLPAALVLVVASFPAQSADDIYAKAVDKFGETGVVDLIAVSGYYDVVSMTLNVAHVAPPKDAQLPFKQAGR